MDLDELKDGIVKPDNNNNNNNKKKNQLRHDG